MARVPKGRYCSIFFLPLKAGFPPFPITGPGVILANCRYYQQGVNGVFFFMTALGLYLEAILTPGPVFFVLNTKHLPGQRRVKFRFH